MKPLTHTRNDEQIETYTSRKGPRSTTTDNLSARTLIEKYAPYILKTRVA